MLIAIGWGFTFFVMKFDNGSHIDLYGDQAGVWLILMGLGYVATAFHVVKRFLLVGTIHIVVGLLLELSARRIIVIDFLDALFDIVAEKAPGNEGRG